MSLTTRDPYGLFQAGYDTAEIAKMLGWQEARVLREINQSRSARLGLDYPYPPYQEPAERHVQKQPEPVNPIRPLIKAAGC